MQLSSVSDTNLIAKTDSLVREERELLVVILHYLKEIERRRLFSELGYKSLFDLATKRFGYSEVQAYRRIQAMKLLKELPEVEEKICNGDLSLSHMSLARSLFRKEEKLGAKKFSRDEKLFLLDELSNISVRSAEKVVLSHSSSPQTFKSEHVKAVSTDLVEVRFTAPAVVIENIAILKGFLAHTEPNITLAGLFQKMGDLAVQEWAPSNKPKRARKSFPEAFATSIKRRVTMKNLTETQSSLKPIPSQTQIRRSIFENARNKCENCSSIYALEIDHKKPKAKGGGNTPENLRTLCRSCNQRAAIRQFGIEKVPQYIS